MKKTARFAVAAFVLALMLVAAPKKAVAQFGVKAGLYTSQFSDIKDFKLKNNVGFQAGVLYKLHVTPSIVVQPELLYVAKETKLESKDGDGVGNGRYGMQFMQVPVSLQYGPNLVVARPFFQVVPYINYALGKSDAVGSWDDINRFGYGIGLGAGVDVWRFQFNARYNWDFSKVGDGEKGVKVNGSEWKASKARGIEFSVAFTF
ncbi:MAG: PorT family protein [Bacteroidales bacterium]|nr:PorT family protein [Bacteroidales bacterium]